jgi:glutathionylspermidine synthase
MRSWARKPVFGREGNDVLLVREGETVASGAEGGYGEEGFVFQALYEWGDRLEGRTPVLGAWLVQGEPAGLGIRESDGPITDDASRFVPHLIE